jgi:hypothetical protein
MQGHVGVEIAGYDRAGKLEVSPFYSATQREYLTLIGYPYSYCSHFDCYFVRSKSD